VFGLSFRQVNTKYFVLTLEELIMKKIAAALALSLTGMSAQALPVIIDIEWAVIANANAAVDYSSTWTTQLGDAVDVIKSNEICIQTAPSTACGEGKAWPNRNGLAGDWISGQDAQGDLDARYFVNVSLSEDGNQLTFVRSSQFIDDPASFFFGQDCPGGCNVLTAVFALTAPNQFTLASLNQCVPFGCQSPDGAFSGSASVIPVPAAAWLFASALGLMGWLRRRRLAA